MANLTIDRGATTAASLNNTWIRVRNAFNSVMPDQLKTINGISFYGLELSETDQEATEITRHQDILSALIHYAMRTMGTNNFTLVSDTDSDRISIGIIDTTTPAWSSMATIVTNYENLVTPIEPGGIYTTQEWATQIRVADYFTQDGVQLKDIKDYVLNDGFLTAPIYTNPTGNENEFIGAYFNANLMANNLFNNNARLLIGNNNPNQDIDLNLNNSESQQLLSKQKRRNNTTPIQNLNIEVINDQSVKNNLFIQLDTGDRIPTSYLPPTTLQKALKIVNDSVKVPVMSTKRVLQQHALLTYTISTGAITYAKYVTSSSGQSWFNDGYLGTEQFDGLGFDEWDSGNKRIITRLELGISKDLPDGFGNKLSDWFVYAPTELTDEDDWTGYSEGVTPSIPSCSTDSLNDVSEEITSQINGVVTEFTLSQSYESGSLKVYWNGQRQGTPTITELTATTFRTSFVPVIGNVLLVDYTKF